MPSQPPLIVVVGDLHCGSVVGLCPPDFITQDGSSYGLNRTQQWIWECWCHFTEDWLPAVVGDRAFSLVFTGDLTEGTHHSNGREVVHGDPGVHAKIALEVLEPLAEKATRTYVVRGTDCHVGSAEARIGERLGAVVDPETGEASAHHWLIEAGGVRLSFQHHIGTTSRIALAATGLSIALAEEQAQCARAGVPVPQVVCRAHRHVYGTYSDDRALIVAGPSWQAKTIHAHKVVPASGVAIGAYVLDFAGTLPGGLPVVRPCIYRPKAQEARKA
jgi:hypothetical protein